MNDDNLRDSSSLERAELAKALTEETRGTLERARVALAGAREVLEEAVENRAQTRAALDSALEHLDDAVKIRKRAGRHLVVAAALAASNAVWLLGRLVL